MSLIEKRKFGSPLLNPSWIKKHILSQFLGIEKQLLSNYLDGFKTAILADQQRKFHVMDAKIWEIKAKIAGLKKD